MLSFDGVGAASFDRGDAVSFDPGFSAGADTTFSEGIACPAARLARTKPARAIPKNVPSKNRRIALPIQIFLDAAFGCKIEGERWSDFWKSGQKEDKQLATPSILTTFLYSD